MAHLIFGHRPAIFSLQALNKAMKRLNPDHVIFICKAINSAPYFGLLSMKVADLRQGTARAEVVIEKKHLQPYGFAHGGACASLVDAASFWAVYGQMDEGLGLTTVDLKVNYLAPVPKGLLVARGRSLRVGRSLCLCEASVENEKGDLVAHGTSTLMVLEKLAICGAAQAPPKFLD